MIDGLVRARENIYEESEKDLFVRDLDDETFNKKTHRHSTDEFGYTDAAFTGLFFLNVSYAPRFKEIEERTLHSYTHSLTRSKSTLPVVLLIGTNMEPVHLHLMEPLYWQLMEPPYLHRNRST